MKVLVKEKDLVIGDRYVIGKKPKETGIFVGSFITEPDDGLACYFYPDGETKFLSEDDGTVGFWIDPNTSCKYEEV